MKNILSTILIFLGLLFGKTLFAQYEVVEFHYQHAYFNNGQPLPAESRMIISGDVNPKIEMVEIAAFKAHANKDKAPLYQSSWRRMEGDSNPTFSVPFTFKLKGNTDYDFVITYYRGVSPEELAELQATLFQTLDAYIDHTIANKDRKVKLIKTNQVMIEDMNTIVWEGMSYYKSSNQINFQGFSDVIKEGFKVVEKQRSEKAVDSLGNVKTDLENSYVANLKTLIHKEAAQVLHGQLMVRTDVREILEYGTEKTRGALALNVGYGGVFLDGDITNASYDTSPYVGISFPLANRAYANRFWSNMSLSAGVFWQNFEDADENEISGPIFGRPYYLGLGYNVFRFIKLNVGAVALENKGLSNVGGGSASLDVNAISLQPFVGLSAEIDLWMGFREKR